MRTRSQPLAPAHDAPDAPAAGSLHRGLEILRCFQPGESALSTGEIARRLALPRATARRLLDTLAAHGFLFPVPDSDAFRLHVACFVLGQAVLGSSALVRKATPVLQVLANRHDMHCLLCVRDRDDMLVLAHQPGNNRPDPALDPGSRLPVADTAPGHAWLWTQSVEIQNTWLGRLRALPGGNARVATVYQAFHDLMQDGVCTSFGQWRRDLGFVAAPVAPGHPDSAVIACAQASTDPVQRSRFERQWTVALLQAAATIRNEIQHID